jgi:hypothetical protein
VQIRHNQCANEYGASATCVKGERERGFCKERFHTTCAAITLIDFFFTLPVYVLLRRDILFESSSHSVTLARRFKFNTVSIFN